MVLTSANAVPTSGDWRGIYFVRQTTSETSLSFVNLSCAGEGGNSSKEAVRAHWLLELARSSNAETCKLDKAVFGRAYIPQDCKRLKAQRVGYTFRTAWCTPSKSSF